MILELIRNNKAPAAIINIRTEPLLTTGPVVSKHFYEKYFPVLTIDEDSFLINSTLPFSIYLN